MLIRVGRFGFTSKDILIQPVLHIHEYGCLRYIEKSRWYNHYHECATRTTRSSYTEQRTELVPPRAWQDGHQQLHEDRHQAHKQTESPEIRKLENEERLKLR